MYVISIALYIPFGNVKSSVFVLIKWLFTSGHLQKLSCKKELPKTLSYCKFKVSQDVLYAWSLSQIHHCFFFRIVGRQA